MPVLAVVAVAAASLILAYFTYARWLSRRIFGLDAAAATPACERNDDQDFVPTKKSVLFGHHFTSIAGTGPIVGPAIAVMWGWLPAVLWVVLGSIFIGMLHDLGSLVVSLRNKGRTLGDIAGDLLGPRARVLFLSILILGLWIVLAVFGLVIAAVLKQYPAAVTPVVAQVPLALLIGVFIHRKGKSIVLPSLIALAVMLGTVWLGAAAETLHAAGGTLGGTGVPPVASSSTTSFLAPAFLHPVLTAIHWFNTTLAAQPVWVWTAGLLVYAYAASVLPVWTLLQPRDYINALQLVLSLGLIVLGLIAAAVFGGAAIPDVLPVGGDWGAGGVGGGRLPLEFVAPVVEMAPAGAPPLLPMLFITIACGACSGFHCLVASGTTSKQLRCETHAKPVAAGSMLTEGFLAVLVIVACAAGLGLGAERIDLTRGGQRISGNVETDGYSIKSEFWSTHYAELIPGVGYRIWSWSAEGQSAPAYRVDLGESRAFFAVRAAGPNWVLSHYVPQPVADIEVSAVDEVDLRSQEEWAVNSRLTFIYLHPRIPNLLELSELARWDTLGNPIAAPSADWYGWLRAAKSPEHAYLVGRIHFDRQYTSWQAAGSLGRTVGAFVQGAGNFLAALGIPIALATALMAVMVAAFAATTMDTACRLQRYVIQELSALFLPKRKGTDCTQCGYDCGGGTRHQASGTSEEGREGGTGHQAPGTSEEGSESVALPTSRDREGAGSASFEPSNEGTGDTTPKAPDAWYPVPGASQRCPECGTVFDPRLGSHGLAVRRAAARWFNPFKWLATVHRATVFAVVSAFVLAMGPVPSATLPAGGAAGAGGWFAQFGADLALWFEQGGRGGLILWPLFGATNQLLAGLAFVVVIAWLRSKRKPFWFALPPMGIMLIMPAWAMSWQAFVGNEANPSWWAQSNWLLVGIALATLALEAWLIVEAALRWRAGARLPDQQSAR